MKNNVIVKEKGKNLKIRGDDCWALEISINWKNIGDIEVSQASIHDIWALKHWFLSLYPKSRATLNLFPVDERIEVFIARHLKRSDKHIDIMYNAWLGDKIIGHFFIWDYLSGKPEIGFGILDNYQKNKLGYFFAIILINIVKLIGKKELCLTTMLKNEAAFNLYKSIGFERIGETETVLPGYDYTEKEHVMKINLVKFK